MLIRVAFFLYGSSITQGVRMPNTRKEDHSSSTVSTDGHTPQQPYSCQRGLLRSVSVLDKWLEDNEGKIADEVRLRRVKRWREEALEQLRLNP